MDQHFHLEYFETLNSNEFELMVSFIRIKQKNSYAKIYMNVKQISGKNQLAPDCLTLAGAIIRQDIKSAERLGYHCGMESWPAVKLLMEGGYFKIKLTPSAFEDNFIAGAEHSEQKLGHA